MSYPRRIASSVATLNVCRTVVCDTTRVSHWCAVICRACRIQACHTRRVSQLLVRHECDIAFDVQGGDACAETAGGHSIQQWALSVINDRR